MNQVQLTKFFNDLFGGYEELGFIELRSLTPLSSGRKESNSLFIPGHLFLAHGCPRLEASIKDWYYGVLPRSQRDSHKSAVTQARVLWADIDSKDRTKEECISGLYRGSVPSPSYIVDSGGGIHAYWLLSETISPEQAEDMSFGLARSTNGDHCHNADRILRVPGTFNFKNPEQPREVKIISSSAFRYQASDFERYEAVGKAHRLYTPELELEPVFVDEDELRDVLPDFLVQYIQEGLAADVNDTFKGDRSRLDFYIMTKLMRNGFSVNQIAGIFLDSAYAISEKTLTKRGRARENYLKNSLMRAAAVVDEDRVEERVC